MKISAYYENGFMSSITEDLKQTDIWINVLRLLIIC